MGKSKGSIKSNVLLKRCGGTFGTNPTRTDVKICFFPGTVILDAEDIQIDSNEHDDSIVDDDGLLGAVLEGSPTADNSREKRKKGDQQDDRYLAQMDRYLSLMEKMDANQAALPTAMQQQLSSVIASQLQELNAAKKKRNDTVELTEEDPYLVEKSNLTFRDNQQEVIDWQMRNLIKPLNGDPKTTWGKAPNGYEREVRPRLGGQWFTNHIMGSSVAQSVMLTTGDRGAFVDIKKFLERNSSCMRDAADSCK